ncbi:TNFAIP3-interacting protein 1-like [Haliotis rufescens]|uniref:TNFAIP3-interacting protein 1-like n=1 Tax=Haliotis rufescens TaxID=6454 RepID=UPI00201EFB37|nr:TNFAIP3-interacting protein 1-like [Haliotis rufescens]XP_046330475.2 TNFAIP3-interacting protein 1-like [Haliotis rufescens]XP_048242880.1 TNFAIP3-interacting protein 1-like [Haliotis rufescens]
MFEIETRDRSSSPNGASSDVTPANQQLQDYEDRIKRLENENKVLHGRIRGYKTLGDLLQEAKEENKKLVVAQRHLKQKLDSCTSINGSEFDSDLHSTSQTTTTTVKLEPTQNTDMNMTQIAEADVEAVSQMGPSHDPGVPTITERSVASNRDNAETSEMHGSIREITPMQESMVDTQNDLSRTETGKTTTKGGNMTQNLELDSDRYEEPEYEKVGHQMAYKPGSMSSMSVISSGPDEKYNFPSLSSGTSRRVQDVRPKTYQCQPNEYELRPMDSELSVQMKYMLQMHSTVEEPELAAKFRKMSEDIAKTEEDAKRFKNLAYTFAQENQRLKTSTAMELKELKNQNFELREENKRLISRIKRLEHDRDHLPVTSEPLTSQTRLADWVAVETPQGKAGVEGELFQQGPDSSLPEDLGAVMSNIRCLKKENKELKQANQSWNIRWQELNRQWELKVKDMRSQVDSYKQEMTELQKREKQLQQDCEKMVQNAKTKAYEEETAKEEALMRFDQCTYQRRSLQDQLGELQARLETAIRDKHSLEAELGVLKSRYQGNMRSGQFGMERSREDLTTEIEVLRQQLTVFEEDFDRERQDRAAAQSARDDLQTTLEKVREEKEPLTRRTKFLEQKLKSHEATMQQTLQRNESLQTQLRDLQSQNRRLQESSLPQFQGNMMNHTYPRYQNQPTFQNMPMYPNTPIQGFSPHGQMGGAGFMPQSPQAFNHPQMNMNNPAFMQYGAGPQMGGVPNSPVIQSQWTCDFCTFSNIPSRTVCEMCGKIKRQQQTGYASSGNASTEPVLMSRDVIHPPPLSRGQDVPDENGDLVTDNGL